MRDVWSFSLQILSKFAKWFRRPDAICGQSVGPTGNCSRLTKCTVSFSQRESLSAGVSDGLRSHAFQLPFLVMTQPTAGRFLHEGRLTVLWSFGEGWRHVGLSGARDEREGGCRVESDVTGFVDNTQGGESPQVCTRRRIMPDRALDAECQRRCPVPPFQSAFSQPKHSSRINVQNNIFHNAFTQ